MKKEFVLINSLPITNPKQQTLSYLTESIISAGLDMHFTQNAKVTISVCVEYPEQVTWRRDIEYNVEDNVVIPMGCLAKCLIKHISTDITEDVQNGYWEFSAPFKNYSFKGDNEKL